MSRLIKTTVIAGLMAITLSGCIIEPAHPRRPPPRVEMVPVAPAPGYHWVAGQYRWAHNEWVWVPGHWKGY